MYNLNGVFMYNYIGDENHYEKFTGKEIKMIRQSNNHKIEIVFDDESMIYIYNKGIHHDDIHLAIYEM